MQSSPPSNSPPETSTPQDDTARVLRDALSHDTGLIVAFLDGNGQIRDCNTACLRRLGRRNRNKLLHTPLTDHLSPHVADLHRQAQQHAQTNHEPVRIDGPFGDRMSLATYRPLRTNDHISFVLVVAPWVLDRQTADDVHTIQTPLGEDHPLTRLTRRELHVLRGIAGGLSTAEIGHAAHRSVKTIEGHRVTLGAKLGARNRVELARFAWLWGVEPLTRPEDPPLKR